MFMFSKVCQKACFKHNYNLVEVSYKPFVSNDLNKVTNESDLEVCLYFFPIDKCLVFFSSGIFTK